MTVHLSKSFSSQKDLGNRRTNMSVKLTDIRITGTWLVLLYQITQKSVTKMTNNWTICFNRPNNFYLLCRLDSVLWPFLYLNVGYSKDNLGHINRRTNVSYLKAISGTTKTFCRRPIGGSYLPLLKDAEYWLYFRDKKKVIVQFQNLKFHGKCFTLT